MSSMRRLIDIVSENRWVGLGFSVRSDYLWPALLMESKEPSQASNFNQWLSEQQNAQSVPAENSPCIIAMIMPTPGEIYVMWGQSIYVGQNSTHYQLRIDSGVYEYSKRNQIVFDSKASFEKFIIALKLKYEDQGRKIEITQGSVMETARSKHNEPDQLKELAPSPGFGGDDDGEITDLKQIAEIIYSHIGDKFTVERMRDHRGKFNPNQPGYKFTPRDRSKHGMAKIWCVGDRKHGEYPTYNTVLYWYHKGKDGKVIAEGRHTERAVSKTRANAYRTAELILNHTAGALRSDINEALHTPLRHYRITDPILIRNFSEIEGSEMNINGNTAILTVDLVAYPKLAKIADFMRQRERITEIPGPSVRNINKRPRTPTAKKLM